jgi:hypothetical protein
MTYSEFENRLLIGLVDATGATQRGQCEARQVAETVLPGAREQWVGDAVQVYDQQGYLGPAISRGLDGTIRLMISGEGRKAAERLRAQIAGTEQLRPKKES